MMCIESSLTQGYNTGIYFDKVNYPYPKYNWDCSSGGGHGHGVNMHDKNPMDHVDTHQDSAKDHYARHTCNGLPADICNDWNWFWAWVELLAYVLGGLGGPLFGYWIFGPFAILNFIYHLIMMLYGGVVWLF